MLCLLSPVFPSSEPQLLLQPLGMPKDKSRFSSDWWRVKKLRSNSANKRSQVTCSPQSWPGLPPEQSGVPGQREERQREGRGSSWCQLWGALRQGSPRLALYIPREADLSRTGVPTPLTHLQILLPTPGALGRGGVDCSPLTLDFSIHILPRALERWASNGVLHANRAEMETGWTCPSKRLAVAPKQSVLSSLSPFLVALGSSPIIQAFSHPIQFCLNSLHCFEGLPGSGLNPAF